MGWSSRNAKFLVVLSDHFDQLVGVEVVVPLEKGYVEPLLRFFRTRETRARRR